MNEDPDAHGGKEGGKEEGGEGGLGGGTKCTSWRYAIF